MTRKRSRMIMWIIVEIVFIVLIFVGSAGNNDFNITRALSGVGMSTRNGQEILTSNVSFIAKALEVIGEWPALLISSFSAFVIIRNLRKKIGDKLVFAGMLAGDIVVIGLMFYGWRSTFKDIGGTVKGWHYILISVLAIASAVGIKILVEKINKKTLKAMFFPAVITFITAALILAFTEVFKLIWGRVRMREIVALSEEIGAEGAIAKFTSWYRPNWFSGSNSFPSGHAAYNSILLMAPVWLPRKTTERRRKLIIGFVFAWLLIMMFSRLCAAAHYLTDIAFGFIIGFIITQVMTLKYEKTFEGRPEPKFIKTAPVIRADTQPSVLEAPSEQAKKKQTDTTETVRIESASGILKRADTDTQPIRTEETVTVPTRRAAAPAKENIPLAPMRQTSFSLDRARAEKAESDARAAQEAANEAKRLDESLKMASTGEMKRITPDASVPVIPKQKPVQKPQRKTQTGAKQKRKKTAPAESDAVQMHFRYDSESASLTTEISDD